MTRALTVIFAGPSLGPASVPGHGCVELRPPARRGDILLAMADGADRVGLIDGALCEVPAVPPMEILAALRDGVAVFGAASIGALRAAELADFGMVGVGRIYEDYRAGVLTDDDEIALQHGPPELGYPASSEAMVNVRATVAAAVRAGILGAVAETLLLVAKSLHYPERTWPEILRIMAERCGRTAAIDAFAAWLPQGRVDQKRRDALELLTVLGQRSSSQAVRLEFDRLGSATESLRALREQVAPDSGRFA